MALEVHNSPFDPEQVELLNRLLGSLTAEQAVWLAGYLAGLRAAAGGGLAAQGGVAVGHGPSQPATGAPIDAAEIVVLYGSQTGNAMRVAKRTVKRLAQRGLTATACCMSQFRPKDLRKTRFLLVVVSTHGEGEPPDKAKTFHEFLHSRRAPKLDGLSYAVLALGDQTYKHFCKTGKDFDTRLAELGATRLVDRVDCDVDYDPPAEAWIETVGEALALHGAAGTASPSTAVAAVGAVVGAVATSAAEPAEYSRSNPFQAEVLENLNLNGRGSDKETRQLKLSLSDSGLRFEPGDSLGVYPVNDPELVDSLIAEMLWNRDEMVPAGRGELPLREALLRHYEITVLSRPLLEQAARFSSDGLAELVAQGADEPIEAYIRGRDLLDLVRDHSLSGVPARDFLPILRRMPPRLYSIASSHQSNPDEVDLIVVALRYFAHGRQRRGTCSTYIADRLAEGDRAAIYVHENPNFRMPPDPAAPMIMVGPGTGVAPFRAFLEQREETGAPGKNWLFFGDRRFRTDFLCQTEWLRWVQSGLLTRMDVAFSRDQREKVYVQDRMWEHGRELYAWLEDGAYFYVCGDEKRMAPDVDAALLGIVEREGGLSTEQAAAYVDELARQGRYQRDVY